jgi:hypothetical protein
MKYPEGTPQVGSVDRGYAARPNLILGVGRGAPGGGANVGSDPLASYEHTLTSSGRMNQMGEGIRESDVL